MDITIVRWVDAESTYDDMTRVYPGHLTEDQCLSVINHDTRPRPPIPYKRVAIIRHRDPAGHITGLAYTFSRLGPSPAADFNLLSDNDTWGNSGPEKVMTETIIGTCEGEEFEYEVNDGALREVVNVEYSHIQEIP